MDTDDSHFVKTLYSKIIFADGFHALCWWYIFITVCADLNTILLWRIKSIIDSVVTNLKCHIWEP